jgi:hypothetical protein
LEGSGADSDDQSAPKTGTTEEDEGESLEAPPKVDEPAEYEDEDVFDESGESGHLAEYESPKATLGNFLENILNIAYA